MTRPRGTILKRSRGYYAVASSVDPLTGKRTRPRVGPFQTARDARAGLDQLLADIAANRYATVDRTPLGKFLTAWLSVHRTTLKPSTAHGYKGVIDRYIKPVIGGVPLADLRPAHLNALYAQLVDRGLSPRTCRTVHVVIRRALADAVRDGALPRNVAVAAALPRVGHVEQTAWSADEARAFLDATADDPHHTLFVVALTTGMRRGELAGLRWEDVDFDAATITVRRTRSTVGAKVVEAEPKTKTSRRVIDIDAGTVAVLRRWRLRQSPDAYVFPGSPDRLSRAWNAAVKDAGVRRIRFHDARHTAASLMLQAGVAVNVVSRRLGHASPMVTLTVYAHVVPGQGRDAADRLGAVLGTGTEPVPKGV
jgi:integrase